MRPRTNGLWVQQNIRVALMVCAVFLGQAGCQSPIAQHRGAPGIGDPYYADLGNGGYDVQHYSLRLDVDPVANTVQGRETIEAKATEPLDAFNLDFEGLMVDSLAVNDASAPFTRQGHELTVVSTPALANGNPFSVTIAYHGIPVPLQTRTSASAFRKQGWFHSAGGTINVMSEPDGAASWYAANDHPLDKATYHLEISVPRPWVVAATGSLRETREAGGRIRTIWDMDKPMASYLVSINVDRYVTETAEGPGGVVLRSYFPASLPGALKAKVALLPRMLDAFGAWFGPYPFGEYGIVVANGDIAPCARAFGGAMEAQTLSVHCPDPEVLDEPILAHELAHQWFGNDVSLTRWQDLWLKEGFATYAEWMWTTREQGFAGLNGYVAEQRKEYSSPTKVGAPPADDLYGEEVYNGGALTLHALRLMVGDEVFFRILRAYLEQYRYGNASTEDFIAVAEKTSGKSLSSFFHDWLSETTLPEMPEPGK